MAKHKEKSIEETEKKELIEEIEKVDEEKVEKETKNIEDLDKVEKELVVKKDAKETVINPEELEKIEEEIKKQKTIPEETSKKINSIIFKNIILAIGIILFFIFINLGYNNIASSIYLIDLKVFSVVILGIAILTFEKAYKKDSGEYTIYGIEILVLAIFTLLLNYIYSTYNSKFIYIVNTISMIFAIYYVMKSIIIYKKMRNKALKKVSDIRKIIRK